MLRARSTLTLLWALMLGIGLSLAAVGTAQAISSTGDITVFLQFGTPDTANPGQFLLLGTTTGEGTATNTLLPTGGIGVGVHYTAPPATPAPGMQFEFPAFMVDAQGMLRILSTQDTTSSSSQ